MAHDRRWEVSLLLLGAWLGALCGMITPTHAWVVYVVLALGLPVVGWVLWLHFKAPDLDPAERLRLEMDQRKLDEEIIACASGGFCKVRSRRDNMKFVPKEVAHDLGEDAGWYCGRCHWVLFGDPIHEQYREKQRALIRTAREKMRGSK